MQRATKRSTSRLIFGQKKCVASTSSVFFTPKCPINPPPCTSCNNKRRTELVGMHSLFARNTKPSLTTNLFHVLPSLQLPSKIYIRNISTLKWWNIQFQFREMVMISYLRGSPTICDYLHVDDLVVVVLVVARSSNFHQPHPRNLPHNHSPLHQQQEPQKYQQQH